MAETIYRNQRTTRTLHRKEVEQNGTARTIRWVEDGSEEVIYDVQLDLGQLEMMARTAAANKAQRSKDGPLIVKVTRRRKLC